MMQVVATRRMAWTHLLLGKALSLAKVLLQILRQRLQEKRKKGKKGSRNERSARGEKEGIEGSSRKVSAEYEEGSFI